MSISRRHLPSLSCLAAFEAVARMQSVTDAAHELDLTQSAVSRQIQKLEDQVGQPLFKRDRKRLHLTEQGKAYARDIRSALTQIQTATQALHGATGAGVLDLACLPSFGTHWLAPRLPAFQAAHPDLTLNISSRFVPFDFADESFHAAILYGQGGWPQVDEMKLWDEHMVAIAAPDLLSSGGIGELPRLQLETRPDAWPEWFSAHGWPEPGKPAMVVDQFGTMLQAARAGMGVALLPDYMAAQEVASETLVVLPEAQPVSIGAYYLIWPQGGGDKPALVAFRDWLQHAARQRD